MNVAQILYNTETDRYVLDGIDLHCGDMLKVLVYNGISKQPEWIDTRMELDGNSEWYLPGLFGYQISGLFAKIV